MRNTDLYMMIKIQCHKSHKPESGMEEYILVTPGANRLEAIKNKPVGTECGVLP